jgi:YhcH/YjgK/YiaL family protein
MIIDRIEFYEKYEVLGARFAKAFQLLRTTDFATYKVGKYEVDLQNVFFLIQEYQSKPIENAKIEAHRKYADIQVVLRGQECIGYADMSSLQHGEYSDEKDFQQVFGKVDFVTVKAGFFMILFPNDGHMPGVRINEGELVKKVVFKIRL